MLTTAQEKYGRDGNMKLRQAGWDLGPLAAVLAPGQTSSPSSWGKLWTVRYTKTKQSPTCHLRAQCCTRHHRRAGQTTQAPLWPKFWTHLSPPLPEGTSSPTSREQASRGPNKALPELLV